VSGQEEMQGLVNIQRVKGGFGEIKLLLRKGWRGVGREVEENDLSLSGGKKGGQPP